MGENYLENQKGMIESYWNNFLVFVKNDINELELEKMRLLSEISKVQRLSFIVEKGQEDIDALLNHKESIIQIDPSFENQLKILKAFKERDNLENQTAKDILNSLLSDRRIIEVISSLDRLKNEELSLDEQIEKMVSLLNGMSFDKGLIDALCDKHEIEGDMLKGVLLYPFVASYRKTYSRTEQRNRDNHSDADSLVFGVVNGNDEDDMQDEEIPTYIDEYEAVKEKYETIKEENSELLNKYYSILNEMTVVETQKYKAYAALSKADHNQQFGNLPQGEYAKVNTKIIAFKLFEMQSYIKDELKDIAADNYSNKEDIEILSDVIDDDYVGLINELKAEDEKLKESEKDNEFQENQRVFFATGSDNKPLISDKFVEDGYMPNLINIIRKGQDVHLGYKKDTDIAPLKIDKSSKVSKKVLSLRNFKIVVSFINLKPSPTLPDGGIYILTAAPLKPNTIQDITNKAIRGNEDEILKQIDQIEKGNDAQLEFQSMVMDGIMELEPKNKTEDESNGRKAK